MVITVRTNISILHYVAPAKEFPLPRVSGSGTQNEWVAYISPLESHAFEIRYPRSRTVTWDNPIESQRHSLSGSWHTYRSQNGEFETRYPRSRAVPWDNPIESQRENLSGSWHTGRSQHGQYLGHAGSSVQDFPHRRRSKLDTPETVQKESRGLQAATTSMHSLVYRHVQKHSTPAEIPT